MDRMPCAWSRILADDWRSSHPTLMCDLGWEDGVLVDLILSMLCMMAASAMDVPGKMDSSWAWGHWINWSMFSMPWALSGCRMICQLNSENTLLHSMRKSVRSAMALGWVFGRADV